jgi:hypothetical protein
MPNLFKHNATGTESDSLFKGDWAINLKEHGGGPTGTTGFYNGIDIPTGGYAIYGPGNHVRIANNSTELLFLVGKLGGDNSNLDNALFWAAGQEDVVILNSNFNRISTEGLQFGFDIDNMFVFRDSFASAKEFSPNKHGMVINPSYDSTSRMESDVSELNQMSELTICLLLEKIGSYTGYANHPLNKWNNASTKTASFVVYHFGDYLNNGDDGYIGFYANRGTAESSSWGGIMHRYNRMNVGDITYIQLAYGQSGGESTLHINGELYATYPYVGILSPTVSPESGFGRPMNISLPGGHTSSKVHNCLVYNRRLTEEELMINYQSVQNRINIA